VKLSLSKCWQTTDGRLVFQSSSHDLSQRRRGYLILDPSAPRPVVWTHDKPDTKLSSNGVAAIIRKHAPNAQLVGLALSDSNIHQEFLRLTMKTIKTGKTSGNDAATLLAPHLDTSGLFYISLVKHPHSQIDFIVEDTSYGRLRSNSQYTVRKPADKDTLNVNDLDPESFTFWLRDLIGSDPNDPKTAQPEGPHPAWRKSARDRVARRLKTLKKTLVQDQTKCPTAAEVADAEDDARLLQAYLWMIKPDMATLLLDEAVTGGRVRTINVDPEIEPGENLERLFLRAKKLRRALDLQGPRLAALRKEIQAHDQALSRLRDHNDFMTESDGLALLGELGLASKSRVPPPSKRTNQKSTIGRRFLTLDQAVVTIGRDAKESDLIVKSASAKDWWVHVAGGGHGAHAIISGAATRQKLSAASFRDAAILALHFSDRSRAQEGEVYLARRHQIRKRKGLAPGLWIIERAETKLVRYSSEDIAHLFAREIRDGIQREVARNGNS
jgi:hypothetical protein